MHINCLELLAAMLAAKIFLKDVSEVSLLLELAIPQQWLTSTTCEAKCLTSGKGTMDVGTQQVYHLDSPTHPRSVRHRSRHGIHDKSDWMLCPQVIWAIIVAFGPLYVDLLHPDWHIRYPASSTGDQTPWSKQWMYSNRTGTHWKALPTHHDA